MKSSYSQLSLTGAQNNDQVIQPLVGSSFLEGVQGSIFAGTSTTTTTIHKETTSFMVNKERVVEKDDEDYDMD